MENPADFPKPVFIWRGSCRDTPQLIYKNVATHLKKNRELIKKLIFILITFIAFSGFAQSDNRMTRRIEIKTYQIESDLGKKLLTKRFVVDSAQIKADKYQNKLVADIKFKETGNKLTADIYFDSDKIILIKIKEPSPYFKNYDDAEKQSEFYFKNENLIDEKIRITIPSVMHGVGMPKNLDKEFKYNEDLTTEYLIKLTHKIIELTAE
ncbi:hypothetical protein K8089_15560 [Aequorivita sp. F47161]|uniref:Uncharacterized protein n=1 Tax=Aequorivita vitellina TaxID=2874475 RepID=A0A9X1QWV3_9FLAO|nr:hypothetical protein [Aequorivita vitellina]MCG2420443.1 hypothetical protein [Aequorivita vitellina]